jgi:hypothetical protein
MRDELNGQFSYMNPNTMFVLRNKNKASIAIKGISVSIIIWSMVLASRNVAFFGNLN